MLKILIVIFLLAVTRSSSGQGSWNIGYIPIDSINKKHVGSVVRIDFRNLGVGQVRRSIGFIRSYIIAKDTGIIRFDTGLVKLTEIRKIYVDHGNYYDQYLECSNYFDGAALRIYDAEIVEVNGESILFKIETALVRGGSVKADKSSKVVRIERSKLDGVMFKL